MVSITSTKARSTARFASQTPATSATPHATASTVSARRAALPRVKRRAMRSHAIYHTMVIAAALTPEDGASTRTFAPAASVPAASASAMASARLVVLVFP